MKDLTILELQKTLNGLGFELILEEDIKNLGNMYRVYWRDDGLIVSFDSYLGDKVINGGHVNGNLMADFNNGGAFEALTGSSHSPIDKNIREFKLDIRFGSIGCSLESFTKVGKFLNPWAAKSVFLHLNSYMDWKGEGDFQTKCAQALSAHNARVSVLPKKVRKCIDIV